MIQPTKYFILNELFLFYIDIANYSIQNKPDALRETIKAIQGYEKKINVTFC